VGGWGKTLCINHLKWWWTEAAATANEAIFIALDERPHLSTFILAGNGGLGKGLLQAAGGRFRAPSVREIERYPSRKEQSAKEGSTITALLERKDELSNFLSRN
jgi:hypothetical protein